MSKIIIFISSILLLTTLNATLTKRLKEKIFEPKDCLPKIIETYTFSAAPSRSLQSDEAMLRLCPNLLESCCLKNNLNDIHQLVLKAINSLRTFESEFVYIMKAVQKAKEETLQALYKALNIKINGQSFHDEESIEEDCEEVIDLKKAIEYVLQNHEVIAEDLKTAIDYVISVNSRFGCAICDRENLSSFANKKTKNPILLLDLAQCKSIFAEPQIMALFRLDHHSGFLYTIIRSMAYVEKGSAPHDTFITEDELSNMPHMIEDCVEDTNFIKKLSCQQLCLSSKFFNGNPFLDLQKNTIAGRLLSDHYLLGHQKMNQKELNETYERMESEIVRRLFVMPHKKTPFMIEFFERTYKWNSGWNIMNFEMNYGEEAKPMKKESIEEFILRAVRHPEELFENVKKSIPFVNEESSKIMAFTFMIISFFMLSN